MLHSSHSFHPSFCIEATSRCKSLIENATSFNLVAFSGIGITSFVKNLEQNTATRFIYVNPYEMHELNREAVYNQLSEKLGVPRGSTLDDMRTALQQQLSADESVVLLFNRFDRVRKVVDAQFYENIRYLRDINPNRIVIIFVTTEPLVETLTAEDGSFMSLINRMVYFAGYSNQDMQSLLAAEGSRPATRQELTLAGGHHLVLQVIMGCQDTENALSDPMVELLLRDLVASLSLRRRNLLLRLFGTNRNMTDQYFLQSGLLRKQDIWQTFSPLLDEYLTRAKNVRLPIKERALFELLLKNKGRVVSKPEIFDTVWPERSGIASDWSLNALVYRLRRHAGFDSRRYEIESHKKSGYILIDTHDI